MQSPVQMQVVPVQNLTQVPSSTISTGGSVFVRVISDCGDGTYLVSAGGNRINVHSQNPLSVGQTFVATVGTDSAGTVTLSPVAEKTMLQNQPQASTADFIYGQGIASGDLIYRVVQFMEQSGMKIDRSLMDRAVSIGKRFPGKEKLASEAAAILLSKGINPSDDDILALMALSIGDYGGGKNHGQNQGAEKDPDQNESQKNRKLQDGGDFLSRIYPDGTGDGQGLLTYMNHVSGGRRHWIFLPYEWKNRGMNLDASGTIRLLVDLESKSTEKILLNCKLNSTKFFFVVYCRESKGEEVRFFTLPPLLPSRIRDEELRLGGFLSSGMSLGNPVTVTYSDSACSDGLCTVDEMPSTVETLA